MSYYIGNSFQQSSKICPKWTPKWTSKWLQNGPQEGPKWVPESGHKLDPPMGPKSSVFHWFYRKNDKSESKDGKRQRITHRTVKFMSAYSVTCGAWVAYKRSARRISSCICLPFLLHNALARTFIYAVCVTIIVSTPFFQISLGHHRTSFSYAACSLTVLSYPLSDLFLNLQFILSLRVLSKLR